MLRGPALLLALLLLTTGAGAAESSYALTYRPAEECPPRETFVAELAARSHDLREATNEAPEVTLEVWFEGRAPIQGVLLLRDAQGQTTQRSIQGATCGEIVAALALTASLLIDAKRQSSPAPVASGSSDAPPTAPSPASPARPEPAAVVIGRSAGAPRKDEHRSPLRFHVGIGAALEHGVAPSVAGAGALELAVAWRRPSIVQPLLSVTLERTLPETVTLTQGEARFRWTAFRVGACPLRVPSQGGVAFRPCGSFEGGVIEASGIDVPDRKDVSTEWWAAGISGRVEFGLFEPLSALFELGARLQFKEDRFYLDPDSPESTVFEVAPWGLFGRLGVEAQF